VRRLVSWLAVLCVWQMPATQAAAQDASSPQPAQTAQAAQPLAPPVLAAAAGGEDDVVDSVLIGPGGQVYEPIAPGTWQRRFGGGIAPAVVGAAVAGQTLFAHGDATPVFRLDGTAWHAHPLPNRGPCVLGRGAVAALAIGPHVYTWRDSAWSRLASVQGRVSAVWTDTQTRAHAATTRGSLWRIQGSATTAVPTPRTADDPIVQLTGRARALYGVTRSGAVLRIQARATLVGVDPALAGWVAQVAVADASGTLWALGWNASSGQAVLARTRGNVLIPVDTMTGLTPADRFIALHVDRRGGMLWATESGTVRYHVHVAAGGAASPDPTAAGWQVGQIRAELASPVSQFPGRGPARAR
jgi:hypothetical protein